MTKEALKLALEALEANQPVNYCMNNNGEKFPMMQEDPFRFERNTKAIAAIKEALAQPEQEQLMSDQINYGMSVTQGGKRIDPMSIYKEPEHDKTDVRCECCGYMTYHREHLGCIRAAKLKEPEQEPVAWRAWVSKFPQGTGSDWVYVTKPIMKDRIHNQPLYTTPPQRTWVGLTDEEILAVNMSTVTKLIDEPIVCDTDHNIVQLGKAIEAKLKEKNT